MGIYNAVNRIKIVPEMVLGMLLAPLLPVLAEKYAQADVRGYQKTAYSAFVCALLVTAPYALLQIAAPVLTLFPYGNGYAGHTAVVQWLMAELAILGVFTPMNQLVSSMNKMWFGFGFNLVWSLVYGGLACLLVPRYGAAGLAASPLLAHLLCLGPCLFYIHRAEPEFLVGMPLGRLALILSGFGALAFICSRWFSAATALLMAILLIAATMLTYKGFFQRADA
jgi:O-antigen/teichoic acid export membrane protein